MRLACPVVATAVVLGLGLAVAEAATGRSPSAHRFGCRPQPGIGSVAVLRGKSLYTIDLATCRQHRVGASGPGRVAFGADGRAHVRPSSPLVAAGGRFTATVRVTGRQKTLRDTIWVTDRQTGKAHAVFSAGEWGDTRGLGSPGPIVLFAWSADARWLFFAIDPGASGSIAADGLILQVVSANAGGPHRLRVMLPDTDYLTWCGGRLVFTAGADRVATDNKRLLSAVPPAWRVPPLVNDPGRAWGSLACAPDHRSIVVQSQPQSSNAGFFATHWSLCRVDLDGASERLTSPPEGYTDESPRYSRDGSTIMFVRSHNGQGKLYALAGRRVHGPLLTLGYSIGFYGHQDWWRTMAWSFG